MLWRARLTMEEPGRASIITASVRLSAREPSARRCFAVAEPATGPAPSAVPTAPPLAPLPLLPALPSAFAGDAPPPEPSCLPPPLVSPPPPPLPLNSLNSLRSDDFGDSGSTVANGRM